MDSATSFKIAEQKTVESQLIQLNRDAFQLLLSSLVHRTCVEFAHCSLDQNYDAQVHYKDLLDYLGRISKMSSISDSMKSRISEASERLQSASNSVSQAKMGQIVSWPVIKRQLKREISKETGSLTEDQYRKLTDQYFNNEPIIKLVLRDCLNQGYAEYKADKFSGEVSPEDFGAIRLKRVTGLFNGKGKWIGFYARLKNGSSMKGYNLRDLTVTDVLVDGKPNHYWSEIISRLNESSKEKRSQTSFF